MMGRKKRDRFTRSFHSEEERFFDLVVTLLERLEWHCTGVAMV
jgi:hypothetical protein